MCMLNLLFLFLFLSLSSSYLPCSFGLNIEGRHLIDVKNGLEDPSNFLSNWNERDLTPCGWTGITCDDNDDNSTVSSVDFTNFGLVGPFPTSLCLLPKLSFLSLQLNYINNSLTNTSLQSCTSLTHLDLSFNNLVGSIPDSLPSSLSLLRHLDLSYNNFSGAIPSSLGLFPRLENLTLVNNLLTSEIPPSLSKISTLRQLNLSYNPFSPGPIPPSFGDLSSLQTLWLAGCNLIGDIPPSLGSLSSLNNLDLTFNSLSGSIPEELAAGLSSIVQIELYNNSLTGPIPYGLSNLASLRRIDASMNRLEGPLPSDLFDIPLLDSLHLYQNRITGEIPSGISNSKSLVELRLFGNRLNGTLPSDLGKNSKLMFFDLSDNHLSGEIPSSICHGGLLQELLIIDNFFSGTIPDGLASCQTLTRVRLANNRLSGEIPPGLWGLPHVWLLELNGNSFTGNISSTTISGAYNLSKLIISDNQFVGDIPWDIGSLANLYQFSAGNNRLTGPIPSSLANLTQLGQLDLHNNSLTGGLLIGSAWTKLSELNLADNDLTGNIPPELGSLPVLNYLDLSWNLLTGDIPTQLQNLKLERLNLSNNQLSGSIPPMFRNGAYRASFLNNPALCGDTCPGLPNDSPTHRTFMSWLFRLILVFAGIVLVMGLVWFYLRYRKFNKAKLASDKSKWTLTSFHKLGFSEYEVLDCLDEDNVIGSGASGKVYKAVLSSGEAVAVKKLWGGTAKNVVDRDEANAFRAEVTTLGKIRHKNIVKLWCTCSHKDCKLLVYEYMPNGSLGDLLRRSKGSALDWPTRYKIAVDAAEGLSYLHHDCVPAIVHRDVKSNNILLDADFGARVADFGVAKAIDAVIGQAPKSMSVIAGSCGYIAPEYAYTLRVTEKSDIYSFGVVLLELVTGKPPIGPEFGEKDLVKWVCATMEQKGIDHVLDTKLDLALFKMEISKVLNIGLLCTSALPINRPSMRRVVKMLLELDINDDDGKSKPKVKQQLQDGKLSPYYYYQDASYHQEN